MHFVIFVQKDYSNDLIRDDLESLPVPQNLAWFNDYNPFEQISQNAFYKNILDLSQVNVL
jgi:hypothetical protein